MKFRLIVIVMLLLTAGALVAVAWLTGRWVLTSIVIGLVFGFAAQRAGFCGASILSNVVLEKDVRGVVGAGFAIFVAMLGFAVLAAMGLVEPNPKPFKLLPAVIGGIVFGTGMVFAGGCVSGCLYKAGEGRLTAMLGVIGAGIGTNLMGPGLLGSVNRTIAGATRQIEVSAGLDQMMELSFPVTAAVVGVLGLCFMVALAVRQSSRQASSTSLTERFLTEGWSLSQVGVLVGVLGWFAYLSSTASGRNYPLGVTHGVMALFSQLVGGQTPIKWWLALFALSMVAGSTISAWMRKMLSLRSADPVTLLTALAGGVLVGAGAVIGGGCFVGNILSGWALLSMHTLVFGLFMILANWVTTIFYLRGLK
ncbi:MAG: YeeE/YedE family protein [Candidatus Zixiibacteriota bacterium]